MLTHAMITIQDIFSPLHCKLPESMLRVPAIWSCLLIKKVSKTYYMSVKNSKYPDCIYYKITDIESFSPVSGGPANICISFREPRHQVKVECDDFQTMTMLVRLIDDIRDGKKVMLVQSEMHEIGGTELVAVHHFDSNILDMKHLNKLVLEKCVLPTLPVEIGHLPIEYLSLSDSQLASSQFNQDTFWDWMSENTIGYTLKTLKMDSVGLKTIPFEIMFLSKLNALSVAKNNLTYLPPFIDELRGLRHLNAADNAINYVPYVLYTRFHKDLCIFKNTLEVDKSLRLDHIYKYSMSIHDNNKVDNLIPRSLTNILFDNLINNCVKFKRCNISRPLWHYFDLMVRCLRCRKIILPDHSVVSHLIKFPSVFNFKYCQIPVQVFLCRFRCFVAGDLTANS